MLMLLVVLPHLLRRCVVRCGAVAPVLVVLRCIAFCVLLLMLLLLAKLTLFSLTLLHLMMYCGG